MNTYAGSMGACLRRFAAILALSLSLSGFATADTITLSWTPPTTREDGTAMTSAEIARYAVRHWINGVEQSSFDAPGGTATSHVVNNLPTGRHCFTMRTVDTDGLESAETVQACRKSRPNKPTGVVVR